MTKDELKIFLDEITTYYGLDKIISPKRLELWAGFVDYIPSTALRFIASQIYKNSDTMPRNIPKHMQRWFYEWKGSTAFHSTMSKQSARTADRPA
jgi:hypothetical protein